MNRIWVPYLESTIYFFFLFVQTLPTLTTVRSLLFSSVYQRNCTLYSGAFFCLSDCRLFSGLNRCSRCKTTISSTELVMRAREYVFHVPCFFCVVCMTELRKGDHFGMRDGNVYCRLHYELLPPHPADHNSPVPPPEDYSTTSRFVAPAIGPPPSAAPPPPPPPPSLQTLPSPDFPSSDPRLISQPPHPLPITNTDGSEKVANSFYNGVSAPRPKGRPRKRKPKDIDSMSNLGRYYCVYPSR